MRRALLVVALTALTSALPAGAALQPIRHGVANPLVRAGRIVPPAGHASGRTRVIARLELPPLAQVFHDRMLASAQSGRHLEVRSAASRAYLARLADVQARDATALRRALPQARIGRHYRILLDGFVVNLPVRQLPALARLRFLTRVYPSYSYTEDLNRSPSIIGADVLHQVAGADGAGVKIAVVDDGIDQRSAFFDPRGFAYPPGFPQGGRKWVTPKVIVAKVFPGPNAGRGGRLAVDPRESFHGTHVAGIAAGDANTTAPAGRDHPRTTGLSGVAPRAWLGNYRVFTVPTPIGNVANTPEIIAAFEAAVADGMNVVNFSGGGAQTEPANDALIEAVQNVANAGVVPVIAAGNDRDDFGEGSAGSPGTAPAAISVAAVSDTHVYSPALTVTTSGAPDSLRGIPFQGAGGGLPPASWGANDHELVDVGTILGTDGKPVERHLCGPPGNAAAPPLLPARSLAGEIALLERGLCPFTTKVAAVRRAGAAGAVFVDNRQGEANPVPIALSLPGGTVANLDGANLIAFLATTGGRATMRIGRATLENVTGRGGVITSFSSAGPTDFGHLLKPDVSAPGGQILSATLPSTDRSGFAVFDGTSMATPHVSGAAALLLQLHPGWTPAQVKSALVSTAGPAWGNTARTAEAPVPLEGGGLVALPRANDPQLFTDPVSLSFGDLDTHAAAASDALLVRLTDAGDGSGTWTVALQPQSATPGTSVDVPSTIAVTPGGETDLPVVAHAVAQAPSGEDYGFVVLTRGSVMRRVPYLFVVTRPALASARALPLRKLQTGDTRVGPNRVTLYRYPVAPFGNQPDVPPMEQVGAEHLYSFHLNRPAANFGVAIWTESPDSARVDPWVLGSKNEDEVEGYAGTPVNVNSLMADYRVDVGAAGAELPRQQEFFVSVDSGRDQFSGRTFAGRYTLRSWVNDVRPPSIHLLTARIAAGRPSIAVHATDLGAGVDPSSLQLSYRGSVVAASSYDALTGLALFRIPLTAPALRPGRLSVMLEAADFQETKNVNTSGDNPLPNTAFHQTQLRVVRGTALTWLTPSRAACVARQQDLVVSVSSTRRVRTVTYYDDMHRIAVDRHPDGGLSVATWKTVRAPRGRHVLRAVALDSAGTSAIVTRDVRVCR